MRFHSNIEINKRINISLFQFPCVLGHFSVFLTRFISEITFMVIVTFFESIATSAIVKFISSCNNRCFVKKSFRKAVTIYRAVCVSAAIASVGSRWC